MPDLLQETRVSLSQLAREQCVAIPTTWRWAMKGTRGIRLETIQVGGRRYSTQEAFARFVEATTAVANGEQPSTAARTNRQRQAAIERTECSLDAAGI